MRDRTIRGRRAPLAGGGHILTFDDISDLIRRAQQLQATTDELTGLRNRIAAASPLRDGGKFAAE